MRKFPTKHFITSFAYDKDLVRHSAGTMENAKSTRNTKKWKQKKSTPATNTNKSKKLYIELHNEWWMGEWDEALDACWTKIPKYALTKSNRIENHIVQDNVFKFTHNLRDSGRIYTQRAWSSRQFHIIFKGSKSYAK